MRASKKHDASIVIKTTTITSEFTSETHKNKSRAMLHRMLHDAREYQSLYKDMIDQLYPLMTHAKRAKEGAVGQMDLEKEMIGTTNSHNLRTDITHNGGGQMCQQARITVKGRSNPIEKTVSMSSHISQGEGSTSTHLLR